MDTDLALLDRWRAGDRAAGEDLFTRHFGAVYRFFEHKAGPDADDLAQRTLLACTAARDQFTAATMRVRLLRARRALRTQMDRLGPSALAEAAADPMAASWAEPSSQGRDIIESWKSYGWVISVNGP